MTSPSPSPNIFEYLDFRSYLKDALDYIRVREPGFRFQTLVEKYGLRSRSHYLDIVKGRTLTERYLENYVKICGLKGREAKYFKAMVRYDQSGSDEKKKHYFQELVCQSANLETVKLEGEVYKYFEKWYNPVILAILDLERKECEPPVIAQRFKNKITVREVKSALDTLSSLGFISWNEDKGEWNFHRRFLKSSNAAKVSALKPFHQEVMKQGIKAYEDDFKNQTFSTLTLSVSAKTKKVIDDKIAKLRTQIMELVKTDEHPEIALQVNLQTFEQSRQVKKKK